mmetsp:Transcript_25580/g.76206  ORF Transcript_25580/g.76206 Transcript_25580/m.76206 type:complete len:239 (+) Transcript_25580:39-755(+)
MTAQPRDSWEKLESDWNGKFPNLGQNSSAPSLSPATSCSLVVGGAQALALALRRGRHDQAHDQAVEAQGLREDEDEDHAHKELGLLRVRPHAGVPDDANRQARRQRAHPDREAGGEVRVAREGRVGRRVDLAVDDHRGDEAVDAEDAGHDHGDDGAHDHVRAHDAHGADADAGLGGAVGRAEVGEDDGGRHAHEAEERRGRVALLHRQEGGGAVEGHVSEVKSSGGDRPAVRAGQLGY